MIKTTLFLYSIIEHLFNNVNNKYLHFLTASSNLELRNELFKLINDTDCNTILYLGHGSSKSLGSMHPEDTDQVFYFGANEFSIFSNKNVICLSCNSNELLNKHYKGLNIEAIGFGDLPTGWPDITSVRQYNQDAYKGITNEIINQFNESLAEIIKYSVTDFVNRKLSILEFLI